MAETFRVPPDERTKGLLRLLVAEKFTSSQISEIADLMQVPPALCDGANKSERAGNLIRRLTPEQLKELVATVFGEGFVVPSYAPEGIQKAEAAVRAACVISDGSSGARLIEGASLADALGTSAIAEALGGSVLADVFAGRVPKVSAGATREDSPPPADLFESPALSGPAASSGPSDEVFIVHGHDVGARESVARMIEKMGLKAIVLHEQANEGKTIIEKFEKHAARVAFAVVLLTADDIGGSKTDPGSLRPRARQNVMLELGYFAGRLGRSKVCAIHEEDVELPSDYAGVLYVPLDPAGAWRLIVAKEMKAAGLPVDLNNL